MLNSINLIGRLTKDVEVIKGKEVSIGNFYVAFDQGKEDDTGFIKCKVFSPLTEVCEEWLRKGDKVAISGRVHQQKFQRKDGTNGSEIEILVNSLEFMTSPAEVEEETKPVAKPVKRSR